MVDFWYAALLLVEIYQVWKALWSVGHGFLNFRVARNPCGYKLWLLEVPEPSATLSSHSHVLRSLLSLSDVCVCRKLPIAAMIWSISLLSVLSMDEWRAHGFCVVSLSMIFQVIQNSVGLGCAKASLLSLIFLATANAFSDSPKVMMVVVGMKMWLQAVAGI